jgi:arsenite methyltransferase
MPNDLDYVGIRDAVRKKYAEVARSAEGKFNYPTGRAGALMLGYDPIFLEDVPDEIIQSFCGVGNPFSLGLLNPGEVILDVGCGAGVDLIFASKLVGPSGKVCGIDLTPEMVEKAQKNLQQAGVSNYEIKLAGSESIPYEEGSFDLVISNGVLNLSPLKEKSFLEIYRVLKPNGRLQFADIVLNEDAPAAQGTSLEAWSS